MHFSIVSGQFKECLRFVQNNLNFELTFGIRRRRRQTNVFQSHCIGCIRIAIQPNVIVSEVCLEGYLVPSFDFTYQWCSRRFVVRFVRPSLCDEYQHLATSSLASVFTVNFSIQIFRLIRQYRRVFLWQKYFNDNFLFHNCICESGFIEGLGTFRKFLFSFDCISSVTVQVLRVCSPFVRQVVCQCTVIHSLILESTCRAYCKGEFSLTFICFVECASNQILQYRRIVSCLLKDSHRKLSTHFFYCTHQSNQFLIENRMADSSDEVVPAGWEKRTSRSTGKLIL